MHTEWQANSSFYTQNVPSGFTQQLQKHMLANPSGCPAVGKQSQTHGAAGERGTAKGDATKQKKKKSKKKEKGTIEKGERGKMRRSLQRNERKGQESLGKW